MSGANGVTVFHPRISLIHSIEILYRKKNERVFRCLQLCILCAHGMCARTLIHARTHMHARARAHIHTHTPSGNHNICQIVQLLEYVSGA